MNWLNGSVWQLDPAGAGGRASSSKAARPSAAALCKRTWKDGVGPRLDAGPLAVYRQMTAMLGFGRISGAVGDRPFADARGA